MKMVQGKKMIRKMMMTRMRMIMIKRRIKMMTKIKMEKMMIRRMIGVGVQGVVVSRV